ncbi:hypothetical protein GEV33_000916 [Tenebrio molitor]|uniref:Uncharacterized protein n=2 Tax=Tenebrio molitor TaxID=7067 RepID=A0A8J6HNC2_TENMO|nr:hypothetical protein GEV33_002038 [Tenebrio molitor]KAH0821875.1 hypothetical protein GEV33_000916 [Tenebrio molitor]
MAKVICDNLDVHADMQRAAFDLPSNFLNPRVSCQSLPHIDLGAWRESAGSGCVIGDRQVEVGESAFPSPCTSCICTQEGGQCASLRVTDCSQLLREWPKEVVLRDDVCSAQCGFLLRNEGPQPSLTTDLTPPPARHLRSRQLGRPPRVPIRSYNGFNGFKFPDLSVFIAK